MNIAELEEMTLEQLRDQAREIDIPGFSRLKKNDLILALLRYKAEQQGHELRGGVEDVRARFQRCVFSASNHVCVSRKEPAGNSSNRVWTLRPLVGSLCRSVYIHTRMYVLYATSSPETIETTKRVSRNRTENQLV